MNGEVEMSGDWDDEMGSYSSKSLRVNNQWVGNSILHSYPQQS